MKLGVFTCLLGNLPLEEALKYFKSKGIEMVEIGCGGYPGNSHADPDTLLADPAALSTFKSTVADSGLEISALSCHGNPGHPNKAIAAEFDKEHDSSRREARYSSNQHFLRLPRRPGEREVSQLGRLPLAERLLRDTRVAVERSAHSLLD